MAGQAQFELTFFWKLGGFWACVWNQSKCHSFALPLGFCARRAEVTAPTVFVERDALATWGILARRFTFVKIQKSAWRRSPVFLTGARVTFTIEADFLPFAPWIYTLRAHSKCEYFVFFR